MNRGMFYIASCILLLLTGAAAQQPPINSLQVITVNDGLSQSYVSTFLQDEQGLMWIGTLNGLNRYDGYAISSYFTNPDDPYSLPSNYIMGLAELPDKGLLVTTNKGIAFFDKKKERFYLQKEISGAFDKKTILSVKRGFANDVYILVHNDAVGDARLYDLYRLKYTFTVSTDNANSINWELLPLLSGHKPIGDFAVKENGDIVVVDIDGVIKIPRDNSSKNYLFEFPTRLLKGYTYAENDKMGSIWIGVPHALYRMQEDKITRCHLPTASTTEFRHSGQAHYFLRLDDKVYKTSLHEITDSITNDHGELVTTVDIVTNSLYIDKQGLLWVLMNSKGIAKSNPDLAQFKSYLPQYSLYNLFEIRPGKLWLGYNYPGQILDITTGQLQTSASPITHPLNYIAAPGAYWVLGSDAGKPLAVKLDADLKRIKLYSLKLPSRLIPYGYGITRTGDLVIGSSGSELAIYHAASDSVIYHDYSSIFPDSTGTEDCFAIHTDESNELWIGTFKGLVQVSFQAYPFQPRYKLYVNDKNNKKSLRSNWVTSLMADPRDRNILWVGTRGGGLNRFDKRNGETDHFAIENGRLNDNVVYGILRGGEQKIWVSTNKGLAELDIETQRARFFDSRDGLQSNEFNTYSFLRLSDGQLAFGGINGLNVFDPAKLTAPAFNAPVLFTALQINGQPVSVKDGHEWLSNSITYTSSLNLSHNQNSLTFEFAAMDYSDPSKTQYQFKMDGVDRDWVNAGTTRLAHYGNLKPGNYTFMVRALNDNGQWSDTPATLAINLAPPWWKTRFAYMLYGLALFSISLIAYRLRWNRTRMKRTLEQKQRESDRLKELDEFKSRFYTNITHEFRTPLTMIIGPAEQALQHSSGSAVLTKGLTTIRNNAQQLLLLVNQLLDLRKLEAAQLHLQLETDDIISFLNSSVEMHRSLAEAKEIVMQLSYAPPSYYTAFDKDKLFKVVSNLLSNAIKFTPVQATIHASFHIQESHQQRYIVIEIADTGKGIPQKDLPHIFDHFYRAENASMQTPGIGIGLALVKELVNFLKGSIMVRSKENEGSTFTVTLPLYNEAMASAPASIDHVQLISPVVTPVFREIPGHEVTNGPLVLVVEDSADVGEYIASCIRHQYAIVFAEDGAKGIEKATELVPDLIISDVMMPAKDGFELCATLKSDERTSHIPVILLTALAEHSNRIKGLKRGADAYLSKPFHADELLLVLHNLLTLRKKMQQRYENIERFRENTNTGPQSVIPDQVIEDNFYKKILDIIEQHLDDIQFTVPQLCRLAGISHAQLHRKLVALSGRSAVEVIRQVRFSKAKQLLQDPALSISEVAYATGFSDPAYFTRLFSREFGVSPSEYRKTS